MRGSLLLVVVVIAGCISAENVPPVDPSSSSFLKLNDRVRVIFIGFEDGVAEGVLAKFDVNRTMQTLGVPAGGRLPFEVIPTLDIVEVDASLAQKAHFAVESALEDGATPAIYNGNEVEGSFKQLFFDSSSESATVVFFHGAGRLADHTYRYELPNGALDGVRFFGGRDPFFVFDVSAEPDDRVMGDGVDDAVFVKVFEAIGSNPFRRYDLPLEAGGQETIDALSEALVDITRFRLLQGPVYPVSTRPCHAVTLLVGVRETSLSDVSPLHQMTKDLLDVEALARAFRNLTGEEVFVTLHLLRLPSDDPELDRATRVYRLTSKEFEAWMDANWRRYWNGPTQCEAYVSFLLVGDAADEENNHGTAYSVTEERRLSYSNAAEDNRFFGGYEGPGKEVVRDSPRFETLNYLLAHETGHLFGARHTHDVNNAAGDVDVSRTFYNSWTSMSYELMDHLVDFGAIDRENFLRNRAGYAWSEVRAAGLDTGPVYESAVATLQRGDWKEAGDLLIGLLPERGR